MKAELCDRCSTKVFTEGDRDRTYFIQVHKGSGHGKTEKPYEDKAVLCAKCAQRYAAGFYRREVGDARD